MKREKMLGVSLELLESEIEICKDILKEEEDKNTRKLLRSLKVVRNYLKDMKEDC